MSVQAKADLLDCFEIERRHAGLASQLLAGA
jgi:hypothetical protein